MKTICAWCGSILSDGGGPTSHGICASCRADFHAHSGVALQDFIDSFPDPILVVGNVLDPVILNHSGSVKYGKSDVGKFSIGQVFECDNAKLPEGCGRTIHCSGCAIRQTVNTTAETGEAQSLVPAVLNTSDSTVELLISTVKVDGCIVLRIESPEGPPID